ncbi:MAG: RidA family protein [Phycisphaerae bacterium]
MPAHQPDGPESPTRRAFLEKTIAAAPAAAVLGSASVATAAATATARPAASAAKSRGGDRRVIAARPGAPFSRAVVLDDLVYVAGVVGREPGSSQLASKDFEPQCRKAFENLKASVEAAGSNMTRALKCTCFLTDVKDFPAMNKVFRRFFPISPPARSTIVVKELVVPGAKIEVDCVTSRA